MMVTDTQDEERGLGWVLSILVGGGAVVGFYLALLPIVAALFLGAFASPYDATDLPQWVTTVLSSVHYVAITAGIAVGWLARIGTIRQGDRGSLGRLALGVAVACAGWLIGLYIGLVVGAALDAVAGVTTFDVHLEFMTGGAVAGAVLGFVGTELRLSRSVRLARR
jgi:hypothetical protein